MTDISPSMHFAKALGLTVDQLLAILESYDLALIKPGTAPPFVLDLDSNPHPQMLAGALAARRGVFEGERGDQQRHAIGFWLGYLAAMADATGCLPADLVAWMDRHERTTA